MNNLARKIAFHRGISPDIGLSLQREGPTPDHGGTLGCATAGARERGQLRVSSGVIVVAGIMPVGGPRCL